MYEVSNVSELDSYKRLYFHLFHSMALAVEYIENAQPARARDCLIRAQQEAEEAFLDTDILPEQ